MRTRFLKLCARGRAALCVRPYTPECVCFLEHFLSPYVRNVRGRARGPSRRCRIVIKTDRALAQYGVKGFFWISVVKLATPMLCKDPKKSREGCLLHLKKKTLRAKSWESIQLFWERGGNLGKIPAAAPTKKRHQKVSASGSCRSYRSINGKLTCRSAKTERIPDGFVDGLTKDWSVEVGSQR